MTKQVKRIAVRMGITVPPDVRREMEAIADVNWSQVASDAFRRVVRMNISQPAELRREMDASEEPVNWSSVAAEAFRAWLLRPTAGNVNGGDCRA